MNLKYHGLVLCKPNGGELRFGFAQLIDRCLSWRWVDSGNVSDSLKDTLSRFHNRTYWQCAAKIKDTVHKLDKTISYLGQAMDIFERQEEFAFDGAPLEKASTWFQATDDLPYHLDSLLAYLRIFADCVAFSVPFFFRTKESIANRSFRDQRTWFIEKQQDFDPSYASVLREQTVWFDKLAGKDPKGVRDLHFHNFATYQLGWVAYPAGERTISVQQVTAQGISDSDLILNRVLAVMMAIQKSRSIGANNHLLL